MVRNAILVRERRVCLSWLLPGISSLVWWFLVIPASPVPVHVVLFCSLNPLTDIALSAALFLRPASTLPSPAARGFVGESLHP